MVAFQINLIRSYALPQAARKRLFWNFIVYLCLCAIVFVYQVFRGTQTLSEVSRLRAEMAQVESAFREACPGQDDIVLYGRLLNAQLSDSEARLQAVNEILARQTSLAQVLLQLSSVLPAGTSLLSFAADPAKRAVDFEVAIPAGAAGEGVDASPLVAAWNQDAALMAHVGKIFSTLSRRDKVDGATMYVVRFTCKLKDGGG